MFKQLLCDHDHKLIKEYIMPSQLEIIRANYLTPQHGTSARQLHVLIFKCEKCGKLKIVKSKTPY